MWEPGLALQFPCVEFQLLRPPNGAALPALRSVDRFGNYGIRSPITGEPLSSAQLLPSFRGKAQADDKS